MLLHLAAETVFATVHKALRAVGIEGLEEVCRFGVFIAFADPWILRFRVLEVTFINQLDNSMSFALLLSHLV